MTASERWEDVYAQAPAELRRYMPSFRWSHERLWALDLSVEEVAVGELEWQLELPWWRFEGRVFSLCPHEVLSDPSRYEQQYSRLMAADLGYPLDLTLRRGRWFILDGVHRLAKAAALGLPTVRARKVPAASLDQILEAAQW